MSLTILDTETNDLLKPLGTPLNQQPHMLEICAMRFDNSHKLIKEFTTYVKPETPFIMSPKAFKANGITPATLKDAPSFAEIYKELVGMFLGSHTIIAHNLSFDKEILVNELRRIGKEFSFPYPPINFCTVEQSLHVKGYRLKNSDLYKMATGKEIENAHTAKADVLATWDGYKWLVKRKIGK